MFGRPEKPDPYPYTLARWLLVIAGLVFAIVIVGGITRLTESGLSITDWQPIRGIIPPLTTSDWEVEFAAYRTIPQYMAFNQNMTMDGFKHIYFWEFTHRLLARTIGFVLAGVLIYFWWMKRIPKGYGWRVLLILALGGLQGGIGWWMVASGLSDRTEVSHLRLAVHLVAAMLIYSVLIWTALDLFNLSDGVERRGRLTFLPTLTLIALFIQMTYGAFTAGLRAGYAFASWPMMGDSWFPEGAWRAADDLKGFLFWNPIVVQFIHRWWAWVVMILAVFVARKLWKRRERFPARAIVGLVWLQILLGIETLMSGVSLPIAAAHQACAALVLGSLVWGAHVLGSPPRPAKPVESDASTIMVS